VGLQSSSFLALAHPTRAVIGGGDRYLSWAADLDWVEGQLVDERRPPSPVSREGTMRRDDAAGEEPAGLCSSTQESRSGQKDEPNS
jgi:hypothetical protein